MIRKLARERKPDIEFGMPDTFKGGIATGETGANRLFGKLKWTVPWKITPAVTIFLVGKLDGWRRRLV
jgi:hypothetical protein